MLPRPRETRGRDFILELVRDAAGPQTGDFSPSSLVPGTAQQRTAVIAETLRTGDRGRMGYTVPQPVVPTTDSPVKADGLDAPESATTMLALLETLHSLGAAAEDVPAGTLTDILADLGVAIDISDEPMLLMTGAVLRQLLGHAQTDPSTMFRATRLELTGAHQEAGYDGTSATAHG